MFGRSGTRLALAALLGSVAIFALGSRAAAGEAFAPTKVRSALELLPRSFVPNRGQWDERAAFAAQGFYGTTWVTREGELKHVLLAQGDCVDRTLRENTSQQKQTPCAGRAWVLSERFVGGTVKAIQGSGKLEGDVNFFLGNDPARYRSGVPTYRYVELGEVYPGIAVRLSANQKTVEKIFALQPGADPGKIWVALSGVKVLRVNGSGELVVTTGYGEVVFSKPVAWQEKNGQRQVVEVAYRLDPKESKYGFRVGAFDPARPLWIDPILQSTYLGGSDWDVPFALAIHPISGDIYAAGASNSTDFPNTVGGVQGSSAGAGDVFVARLNASLTVNLQSTYLGGSGYDAARSLAIHPTSGEVYVAGSTSSTNFPNTAGGAQATHGGGLYDVFVARLDGGLTSNLQSTYLGGSGDEYGPSLAIVPGSGEVLVAGVTSSLDLPNTAGAVQPSFGGGAADGFLTRLSGDLASNLKSTYLGGANDDRIFALAIHPVSGQVVVGGETNSPNFPNSAGGFQATLNGPMDAFAARLDANLSSGLQSTYLGGSDEDRAWSLSVHPASGEVYVAGVTLSSDFPNTPGGAQATYAGFDDGFVARLNASLTANLQSTYLGGSAWDGVISVAFHPASGDVYVAGATESYDFPNTVGGAQVSYAGGRDVFVTRLTASLGTNLQSTYLGGWGHDSPWKVAIHPVSGEVYVAGYTYSPDFPKVLGGAQPAYGGGNWDGFVSRLTADLVGVPDMVANGGSLPPTLAPGGSVSVSFSCTNAGPLAVVNATCGLVASAGTISALTCTPPLPVPSLLPGETVSCTCTYTAPGNPGGTDTAETDVTFTFSTGADNDGDATNNTNIIGPIDLVDAINDAVTLPPNIGGTFNVGANDQLGTGPVAGGSFTSVAGTTCSGVSVNQTSGVVTFNAPPSGSCTVNYQVCVGPACDTAQLVVTAQELEPIPTLDDWGLFALVVLLAGAGLVVLRRVA